MEKCLYRLKNFIGLLFLWEWKHNQANEATLVLSGVIKSLQIPNFAWEENKRIKKYLKEKEIHT